MICIQFSQSSKPMHPLFPLLSGGFLCMCVCVFMCVRRHCGGGFPHSALWLFLVWLIWPQGENPVTKTECILHGQEHGCVLKFLPREKECYFCFDYIHALINDYHCLSFQRSSHFSSVTFSLFPEPVGKRESTLNFWKKFFQEASLTLLSQQAAHVETIVKIWHSAIDENRTCHLLQGLLWKFVFGSQIRKIYSSLFAAQSHFLLLRVV